MVSFLTRIKVLDNSGARSIQCIRVLGGFKNNPAKVGDIVVVSVKKATSKGKVKKGEVKKALIVRLNNNIKRKDGHYVSFDSSAAIILNEQMLPIASRIMGPISSELRKKRFMKVLSLAKRII